MIHLLTGGQTEIEAELSMYKEKHEGLEGRNTPGIAVWLGQGSCERGRQWAGTSEWRTKELGLEPGGDVESLGHLKQMCGISVPGTILDNAKNYPTILSWSQGLWVWKMDGAALLCSITTGSSAAKTQWRQLEQLGPEHSLLTWFSGLVPGQGQLESWLSWDCWLEPLPVTFSRDLCTWPLHVVSAHDLDFSQHVAGVWEEILPKGLAGAVDANLRSHIVSLLWLLLVEAVTNLLRFNGGHPISQWSSVKELNPGFKPTQSTVQSMD